VSFGAFGAGFCAKHGEKDNIGKNRKTDNTKTQHFPMTTLQASQRLNKSYEYSG